MAWCPECKAEYKDGVNICSDCNVELVPKLQTNKEPKYDKEAFLISVANDIEAQVIESLLHSEKIPVLKKYREAGGYLQIYMGSTVFGVDLYVPSRLLEKAKVMVNTEEKIEDISISDEENMVDEENDYNKKQRIKTWIILLFFLPGLMWIGIWIIWELLLKYK